MEKLDLFVRKRELLFFVLLAALLAALQLWRSYGHYMEFRAHKFSYLDATVLNHYQKHKKGKTYDVLKLKSDDGAIFYTTSYEDLIDLRGRHVRIGLISERVTFWDYLRGFYAPAFELRIDEKPDTLRQRLYDAIAAQHESNKTKALFGALFLATPVPKELRADVAKLGISHLIAISGFHLGVLFTIFYFLFKYPYYQLQKRYFPYRNMRFDLTVVILVLLFGYLMMLDFIPSLLRAFVMLAYGFFLFHRHFRILSFEVLFVSVLTILAIFPHFLFSIGFWFSVSGVFYIYLFLHHFGELKPWQSLILLNIWVFVLMIPIVHFYFDIFSLHQLYSPLVSLLFVLFYPLEMALHLVGWGGVLDPWILSFLQQYATLCHFKTPVWYLLFYLFLSILAVFRRPVAYVLPLIASGLYLTG